MKNRYNIALIPIKNGNQIIALSHQFKDIADHYLLGDHSLPHVTLCQFISIDNKIPELWEKIGASLSQKTIHLVFEKWICTESDHPLFWISLLPDRCNELKQMHDIIAEIIKNPLNKSYSHYDPHMTLVNTKNKEYKKIAKNRLKSYEPISDQFIVSLGESDDIGQYTKITYTFLTSAIGNKFSV